MYNVSKSVFLFSVCSVLCPTLSAQAVEVRYAFTGRVLSVSDQYDQLPDDINGLSTVSGVFIYDDSVSGRLLSGGTVASYAVGQTGRFEMLIDDTYLFRMDVIDTDRDSTNLEVRDNSGSSSGADDQFYYYTANYAQPSPTHPGLYTRQATVNMVDNEDRNAITSTDLAGLELDLSSFSFSRMEIVGNNDGSLHSDFRIVAGFSSLTRIPDNLKPIANAGPDQTVDCDGPDGVVVLLDGTASSDPDDDALTYEWSVPAGVVLDDPESPNPIGMFPIGITTATLTVTDGNGGLSVDDVVITVVDMTPPEVACTTDIAAIWPPNHDMIPVIISVVATDHCTAPENLVLGLVTIQSNEADDAEGPGDGDTVGDVDGKDGYTSAVDVTDLLVFDPQTNCFVGLVFLRAERDDSGFGRTYSINATVLDNSNNLAETSCVVIVPHDRRKQK